MSCGDPRKYMRQYMEVVLRVAKSRPPAPDQPTFVPAWTIEIGAEKRTVTCEEARIIAGRLQHMVLQDHADMIQTLLFVANTAEANPKIEASPNYIDAFCQHCALRTKHRH